jgi:hypothetical protein
MALELSIHLQKLSKLHQSQKQSQLRSEQMILGQLAAAENMTMERFLEGISYYRVHDQSELLAIIYQLSSILKNKTRIKCIIIDSIAFHFRHDLQDITTRNRLLSTIAQILNQLAYEHKLAIILINHVTTKFVRNIHDHNSVNEFETKSDSNSSYDNSKRLVPALGEQWSHSITNRILLYWQSHPSGNSQRYATLLKSPSMPSKTVCFAVTSKGFRDLPPSTTGGSAGSGATSGTPQNIISPPTPVIQSAPRPALPVSQPRPTYPPSATYPPPHPQPQPQPQPQPSQQQPGAYPPPSTTTISTYSQPRPPVGAQSQPSRAYPPPVSSSYPPQSIPQQPPSSALQSQQLPPRPFPSTSNTTYSQSISQPRPNQVRKLIHL